MMFDIGGEGLTRPFFVGGLLAAALAVSGCSSFVQQEEPNSAVAMQELAKSLQASAQKAAQARVELVKMQPVGTDGRSGDGSASPMRDASSRIDVDYVGPVENALRIVSGSLGWDFDVAGKKRAERLVSMRHRDTDALVILRDIGAQCGSFCDVNVTVREGGRSSILLKFKD